MYFLDKNDLQKLLEKWSQNQEIFAPQNEAGEVMLLPYDKDKFTMDYINFSFPVKEYFFRQKEILFKWEEKDGVIKLEAPKPEPERRKLFFGIRPCDAYGIAYMDKFFLDEYMDGFYEGCRRDTFLAVVNCSKVGESCFCSSMGTGPFGKLKYDLIFTPIVEGYLIEAGTTFGRELLEDGRELLKEDKERHLVEKEKLELEVANKFTKQLISRNPKKVLEDNYNNPIWKKLAADCVSCTGCTNVCPTCTCFNVVEEKNDLSGGRRVRYWDSCQADAFTRNAGEHNPRNPEIRVKYRLFDKFKYIEERFHYRGCSGCGRCIDVCPAAIDIVEIINELAKEGQAIEGGE